MIFWLISTFIIGYTLGSIPFGFILAKLYGLGDIRKIGSGNIGATNMLRTGKKMLALSTLILDASKGIAAVLLCDYFYRQEYAALAGLFAVIGHIFPVWLRFKGGKGVATALGVFLAMNWQIAACVCFVWLMIFLVTRLSSLSSLISIGYSSIIAYVLDNYMTALLCLCISTLIIYTHHANIIRLLAGEEMSFRRKIA
jgi:glycerol-3-phosphate acyltransferase PlsY